MISYEKFWKRLKEQGISQYELIRRYRISSGQLDRLRKNMHVSTHTLEVFCRILRCSVEDIIEHIPERAQNPVSVCRSPGLQQKGTVRSDCRRMLRQENAPSFEKRRNP